MNEVSAPSPRHGALHVVALWAFAVAWPLFDVLTRDAAFFVARGLSWLDVAVLALVTTCVLPLLAWSPVGLAGTLGWRRVAGALQLVLVFVLATLVALPLIVRLVEPHAGLPLRTVGRDGALPEGEWTSAVLALGASALLGVVFAWLRQRWEPVRTLLTVLSLAAPLFALTFVFDPAVRGGPARAAGRSAAPPPGATTSVVLVVLDELPLTSLLDEAGMVDGRLFPNFARLAAQSTWFRNATASHGQTNLALPAIVTGRAPDDSSLLPLAVDHPESLFTLLSATHDLVVAESVTAICPDALSGRTRDVEPLGRRLLALAVDVPLVYGHIVAPRALTDALPSIDGVWGGFWGVPEEWVVGIEGAGIAGADGAEAGTASGESGDESGGPGHVGGAFDAVAHADARVASWNDFVKRIEGPGDRPGLFFHHVMLPHQPWALLPSGNRILGDVRAPGQAAGRWWDDAFLVAQAYQRHMLQLGFVDRLLGQLLDRLEAAGLDEQALLVVVADHGMCFRPGAYRRQARPETLDDIRRVPLFVRRPGQREAFVRDENVETIDILPTIADVLGIGVPWEVDSSSAFGGVEREQKVLHRKGMGPLVSDGTAPREWGPHPLRRQLFGEAPSWPDVERLSGWSDLVGRAIYELEVVEMREPGPSAIFLDGGDVRVVGGRLVPALLRGHVALPTGEAAPERLAIAVDGTIAAEALSYHRRPGGALFSAVVSEDVLGPGRHVLDAYAVGDDGRLQALNAPRWIHRRGAGGRAQVLRSDGQLWTLVDAPGRAAGELERASTQEGALRLVGWAHAPPGSAPVDHVIAVTPDGVAVELDLGERRPDLAGRLGVPAAPCGFSGVIDRDPATGGWSSVRVLALLRPSARTRGVAVEVQPGDGASWLRR